MKRTWRNIAAVAIILLASMPVEASKLIGLQQEDAEQKDIEGKGTDDKSHNEDNTDDDSQEVCRAGRLGIICLGLVAVAL